MSLPTKNLFLRFSAFWLFMLFYKFAGSIHYSLIAPYGEKLLPLWIVGILMGGGSIVQLILDVPAGRIMDRYGYLKFLKITTFVFLLAGLFYLFGLNQFTYYGSLILASFGWLFFGPGVTAYSLSQAPQSLVGRFMATKDAFGSIGVIITAVALPAILLLSPVFVGWILTIFFILSLAFLFLSPADKREDRPDPVVHPHHLRRHSFLIVIKALKRLNPASGMLLLSGLSAAIFYGTIWFVIPLVIASQANSGILNLGLGVFDLAIVLLGYLLGTLADKFNKRSLVFFGLLIFAASASLIGFNFGWFFILLGFIATAGDELAGLALWSWLHSLDKKHANDGAISGVINLFSDFGWAIGPIMGGFIYNLVGPTWTIVCGAIPAVMVWIIYQFIMHRHSGILHESLVNLPHRPVRARHRS